MKVEIQRIPSGVPVKYFEIDAKDCNSFWNILRLPKHVFIRDINKMIIKPHRYLAFTFIGHDISYSVNQNTNFVERVRIQENVIIYLPKWKQFRNKQVALQKRYFSFLKKALYHEYNYHVYLYEEKQLYYLYSSLKNITKPRIEIVQSVIRNFQKKLIKEQEISHMNAPKGKPFCYEFPNNRSSLFTKQF